MAKAKAKAKATNKANDGAVAGVLDRLRKKFGDVSVSTFDTAVYSEPLEWVETDVLAFQGCLGHRGIPTGRIIEVQGVESSGKSTLMDQILGSWQRRGALAVLADTEYCRQREYTVRLGVDPETLVVLQAQTIEGIGERIISLLTALDKESYEQPVIIGWDTIANTPSKAEVAAYLARADGKQANAGPSEAARALSEFFRVVTQLLARSKVAFVCTNQFHAKIGARMFGPQRETYGGKAMKYMPSARIEIVRLKTARDGLGNAVGHFGIMKSNKNKLATPNREVPFLLVYGRGFDNVHTCVEVLKQAGIVQVKGSWSEYGAIKWQGLDGIHKKIVEDEKLYPELLEKFWEVMG
jgi:recombination protein RecA